MADQKFGGSVFLDTLLSTSTIPDHPFNALYLHKILTPFSLANRDEIWTLYVNDRTAWSEDDSMIWQLVRWSETVPINLVSDQQALLVATLLCWFCTSTRSEFRDRSTLTAIRILDQRPSVAEQLIRRFQDSNDPYVSVRVYAIAAGVAMRLVNIDGLTELAATVYETVFASRDVRASLALRDYAACTLEKAESEHRLPQGVNVADFRPPFRSRYPKLWTEKKTQTIEKKRVGSGSDTQFNQSLAGSTVTLEDMKWASARGISKTQDAIRNGKLAVTSDLLMIWLHVVTCCNVFGN